MNMTNMGRIPTMARGTSFERLQFGLTVIVTIWSTQPFLPSETKILNLKVSPYLSFGIPSMVRLASMNVIHGGIAAPTSNGTNQQLRGSLSSSLNILSGIYTQKYKNMLTLIFPIYSTARGGLFLAIKTVKIVETVELLGSVATILSWIITSVEF